jgi:hypothetical protein
MTRMTVTRSITGIVAGAVALGVVAASGSAAMAAPAPDDAEVWATRAIQTHDAMQDHLYLGAAGYGLYRENTDTTTGNPYSFLWEYREATQAAIDLRGIPGAGSAYATQAAERVSGFEHYFAVRPGGREGYESYVPAPLGTGGDVYYDDNAVVGLSFFGQYQATDDASYLEKARAAFDVAVRSWNPDPALACQGGSDWVDRADNTARAANVTGLTAQLGAHLYEETGDASYLGWSEQLYAWNKSCLELSPGLYENSIGDDGVVDPTLWTYNSGAMIATATLLYRATDDPAYLAQATEAATASLSYWTTGDRLQKQPAIFNAFYFKDLLLLDSVSHDPSYRAAMQAYATSTWQQNRDPATGLFHFSPSGGGDYDPTRPAATLDQAAMVQIMAALAWNPDRYGDAG